MVLVGFVNQPHPILNQNSDFIRFLTYGCEWSLVSASLADSIDCSYNAPLRRPNDSAMLPRAHG
jgi:hypothetical protein